MASSSGLRLRARDTEDIGVFAAVLQDALVPLSDMAFQKGQRRFVMVANRFMWEDAAATLAEVEPQPAPAPVPEGDATFDDEAPEARFRRVNCGLRFHQVETVRLRGIDMRHRDQILNLLTLEKDPEGITLVFSDGGALRLVGRRIEAQLEDLGEPWPTDWRPSHRLDDPAQPD